jgi:hypothetical protein
VRRWAIEPQDTERTREHQALPESGGHQTCLTGRDGDPETEWGRFGEPRTKTHAPCPERAALLNPRSLGPSISCGRQVSTTWKVSAAFLEAHPARIGGANWRQYVGPSSPGREARRSGLGRKLQEYGERWRSEHATVDVELPALARHRGITVKRALLAGAVVASIAGAVLAIQQHGSPRTLVVGGPPSTVSNSRVGSTTPSPTSPS